MESKRVIRGSGISLFKPSVTKHTVSHVVAFDPRYSNPNEPNMLLKVKCRNGHSTTTGCKNDTDRSCGGRCFDSYRDQTFDLGRSGLFTADSDGEVIWEIEISLLKLKTYVDVVTFKHKVDLYLTPKPEHVVQFFAAVQTKLSEPFTEKPQEKSYTVVESGKDGRTYSKFSKEFSLENNNQLFRLDLTYLVNPTDSSNMPTLLGPIKFADKTNKEKKIFPSYVADLLENPLSSDVTLQADGETWHLHKWILSARSPVFAAMFSSDMKEKEANVVSIDDVNKKSFDIMINYIYTDDLQDLDEDTAVSLLFLSNRFDLPELRERCGANLTARMNPRCTGDARGGTVVPPVQSARVAKKAKR